jgi:DNA-binding response OmpR family regulator
MANIIFVDDDEKLVDSLMQWLQHEKFVVDAVYSGGDALQMLELKDYDVVILDRTLPDMEGLEICKSYRNGGGLAPVLMLTGKGSISDKEEGLECGADDYLTKPFHPRELVARIRALMRRPRSIQAAVLEAGELKLDLTNRIVTKNDQPVHLTPIEFSLLVFFVKNPRQLFSAETLLHRVWGDAEDCSVQSIYTCVKRLRQKIDTKNQPSIIRTVNGVGWGLEL